MSVLADSTQPCWRWLDWWFTPRWRALVTWFALTAIGVEVLRVNYFWFYTTSRWPIGYLNRFIPGPLPPVFEDIAFSLACSVLVIWFQPLALRLSFRRGMAWVGLPFAAEILAQLVSDSPKHHSEWIWYAMQCGSAAVQCWILWGWRSRPWMWLPTRVLTWTLETYIGRALPYSFYWHYFALVALPGAALLLYGTRLLTPEERMRGAI
jgi:hypothetical protein